MPTSNFNEDEVECPVEGCDDVVSKRGLFMHIFLTDDPESEGHYPRHSVPDGLDLDEVKKRGQRNVRMEYPDEVDLDDAMYFDTYTGKAYEGRRGIMIHLGQMAGRENIPSNVTEKFEADDFPIVETDDDGNIIDVVKWGHPDLPAIEPYIPWYDDPNEGYVPKREIKEFVEKIRDSPTGAASPDIIEEELL